MKNSETRATAVQTPKLLNGGKLFTPHLVRMGKIRVTSRIPRQPDWLAYQVEQLFLGSRFSYSQRTPISLPGKKPISLVRAGTLSITSAFD